MGDALLADELLSSLSLPFAIAKPVEGVDQSPVHLKFLAICRRGTVDGCQAVAVGYEQRQLRHHAGIECGWHCTVISQAVGDSPVAIRWELSCCVN